MQTVHTISQLRENLQSWHNQGLRISFVPTMGNLHPGHLQLIQYAQQLADRTVVSIFVNPLQFGPQEDFLTYPRTLTEDSAKLASLGTSLLFVPQETTLFPNGLKSKSYIEVPDLSYQFCGITRPHFFRGVTTIVGTLFNLVQPNIAVFGEKDYQQLAIVRKMVRELHFQVEIASLPIVREEDGLALSSRNHYLSKEERLRAPVLYQTLSWLEAKILDNTIDDVPSLIEIATQKLTDAGFKTDYLALSQYPDLAPLSEIESGCIILAAAYLGKTRLIDNRVIVWKH